MKIALVVGHSKNKQGASNKNLNITEFQFNSSLAQGIRDVLIQKDNNIHVDIVYRNTYSGLPKKINDLNPDYVVSLHCNAYNQSASGTETLYYCTSNKGLYMAQRLQKAILEVLKLPNRGVKPRTRKDRGGYLLQKTNAPCVILEPFFIDNDDDLKRAQKIKKELEKAIANTILTF